MMRLRLWIIAGAIGLAGVSVGIWQIAAQTSDDGIPAPTGTVPYAEPGSTPRTVNGHVPPPVASPTPTPDLSRVVSPEEAWGQLSEMPAVKSVLDAVRAGDVEALLSLAHWTPRACGVRQADRCPADIADGTELPMLNTFGILPFWQTADSLSPMLQEVLSGGGLSLNYSAELSGDYTVSDRPSVAAESTASGKVYAIALEGAPRTASHWGSLTTLTGFLLIIDSGSDRPILRLQALTPEARAVDEARGLADGFAGQTIISFSTPPAASQQ